MHCRNQNETLYSARGVMLQTKERMQANLHVTQPPETKSYVVSADGTVHMYRPDQVESNPGKGWSPLVRFHSQGRWGESTDNKFGGHTVLNHGSTFKIGNNFLWVPILLPFSVGEHPYLLRGENQILL